MSSEKYGGSVIAVECKRYGERSELNEKELPGALSQARISIPDLDLWVLATSRDISDQIYNYLCETALPVGIEIRTISAGDGSPSSLETLFANSVQSVVDFFKGVLSKDESEGLANRLDSIRVHPDFPQKLTKLKDNFSEQSLGFDHWRAAQNQWLASRFRSKDTRSAFGQSINFAASGIKLIERQPAWKQLDAWWDGWSNSKQPFVLLGEEGDGKTWAVASWINARVLGEEIGPSVIFVGSQQVTSNDATELLAGTIANQLRYQSRAFWEKRITRWLLRPASKRPTLLLVLDGINERHRHEWWRKLLEQLQDQDEDQPWRDKVALLITCRADYWNNHFGNLRTLTAQTWTLPSYDDVELQTALSAYGLSSKDIRQDLLPLIRKPRLLDRVVKLRESIAASGDITPARVVYEDWRDKWERKSGSPLAPIEFQQLIQELATRAREGLNNIRLHAVTQLLSPLGDVALTLNELESSGIFKRRGSHFYVDERRLTFGFGLLLAEQVRQASGEDKKELDEVIAEWLEPHKDMDLKTAICGYAAYHALVEEDFSTDARVILLNAWLHAHTPGQQAEKDFLAYLPLSPESYVALSERVWSDKNGNPWAQELLMTAFLQWRETPKVVAALYPAFVRWLGFVHPDGYPIKRGPDGKNTETIRAEIASRLGQSLTPGPLKLVGRTLTVIYDDGLMRLGRVALAVISHVPRKSFISAITTGCVAEAVMGYPNNGELIAWVLQSSPENLWDELKREADDLLADDNLVAKQAAHRLLSYEGGPEAHQRKQTLPKDLFPQIVLWEEYKKDPCASGFAWRREHCEECVRRPDLPFRFVARQINKFCIDPDLSVPTEFIQRLKSLVDTIQFHALWSSFSATIEDHELEEIDQTMCAFAPLELADVVRRIFDTCEIREDAALRQFSFRLVEHYPIFRGEEWNTVRGSWQKLRNRLEGATEAVETAECFFFANVLRALEPSEQLDQLLGRPCNAIDLVSFENRFNALTSWEGFCSKLRDTSDADTVRRLLWFISAHPENIPDDVIEEVKGFLTYENARVRSTALKIIYMAKGIIGREAVVTSDWSWGADQDPEETHWGSLILSEAGMSVPYRELRSRIHPAYLGYAVYSRGLNKNEVEQFAQDIDQVWSRLIGTAPNLPADFPESEMFCDPSVQAKAFHRIGLSRSEFSRSVKFISRDAFWGGMGTAKENIEKLLSPDTADRQATLLQIAREAMKDQIEAGNDWFARQFYREALDEVITRCPDLVDKWLGPVLRDENNASKLLVLGRSFYEALCEVQLKTAPEKGVQLYWQLSARKSALRFLASGTRIPLADFALFRSPPTASVVDGWEDKLRRCKTNRELLELAITVQQGEATVWLWEHIEQGLGSPILIDQARAATLLGFVDGDRAKTLLRQRLVLEPQIAIDYVIRDAWSMWEKNSWSKHWFSLFLSAEKDIQSWAAFRLFLKCADSRFWIWQKEFQKHTNLYNYQRWEFFMDNVEQIDREIVKNERSLTENFLGRKILTDQVWPWITSS